MKKELLLATAAAAVAVFGQNVLLPADFDSSTTLSSHFLSQYLFNDTNFPYFRADAPYVTGQGNPDDGSFTSIVANVILNRVYQIEPKTSSFAVDFMLQLLWIDQRLAFTNINFANSTALEVSPDLLWTPSIDFDRLAVDVANTVIKPAFETVYIIGDGTGTVLWTRQFVIPFATKFSLNSFPYDSQQLSFSVFISRGDPSRLNLNSSANNDLESISALSSSLWKVTSFPVDNSNPVGAVYTIAVSRNPSSFVSRYILPMAGLCLISSVTFWIDANAFPPRFTGLVALVLAAVTLNVIVSQELPKLQYLTTIDIFIATTFLYVIVSLLLSAAIFIIDKTHKSYARAIETFFKYAYPLSVPLVFVAIFQVRDGITALATPTIICIIIVVVISAVLALRAYVTSKHLENQKKGDGFKVAV